MVSGLTISFGVTRTTGASAGGDMTCGSTTALTAPSVPAPNNLSNAAFVKLKAGSATALTTGSAIISIAGSNAFSIDSFKLLLENFFNSPLQIF